ncbi:MAG: hypothetical protein Q4B84_02200 [Clostridia bacterium]|nr:hypothetical protein [Clostridia bacterium]
MNNKKNFLKRSIAAFLAAISISNFAGDSGKAYDLKMSTMSSFDYNKYNVDELETIANNLHFLSNLFDLSKLDNKELTKAENIINKKDSCEYICTKKYNHAKIHIYKYSNNINYKKNFYIAYLEILNGINSYSTIKTIESFMCNKEVCDGIYLDFILYNDISKNEYTSFDYTYIEDSKLLFVNIDVLKFIKNINNSYSGNIENYFKYLKYRKYIENLDREKLNNKKIIKLISNRESISNILNKLVELLENSSKYLKQDSNSLDIVQNYMICEETKFKLIDNDNSEFLSNVKFKYNKKPEEFSINGLVKELKESGFIGEIEYIRPIALNSIIAQNEGNEQENIALNIKKYKEEIKKYTKTLKQIINNINLFTKIEQIQNEERNIQIQVKELEKIKNTLNIKVENSDKVNSSNKKLLFLAGSGWVAALLGLGYIFKEELKDAYHVAHKKVLELKDKMSSK